MREQLETLKDMVYFCLKDFPKSRNSDVELTIQIWKRYFPQYIKEGKVTLMNMFHLPKEDHISRIRRKFQNEHKIYLPTDWEVAKKRNIAREDWEKHLGYYRKKESGQYAFA